MFNISCVIPARSGSKGIKDKNIRLLNGKPLLVYSIEEALKCNYVHNVYVSTDSEEYAEIAKKHGAKVPFLRNEALSGDEVHAVFPVIDLVEKIKNSKETNIIIMLLPTSPLRKFWQIDKCIELFFENRTQIDSVISVVECKHPVFAKKIKNKRLIQFKDYNLKTPNIQRQNLTKTYASNGSIYVSSYSKLKDNKTFYMSNVYPYIMDDEYSIDINTLFDFKIAKLLLKERCKNEL